MSRSRAASNANRIHDGSVDNLTGQVGKGVYRRAFLRQSLIAGAAALPMAALLTGAQPAFASGSINDGDAAILQFLAAAELIESDLWQQYNELGGIQDNEVPGGSGSPPYINALQQLDGDMPQYIHDNTEDEISHAAFINAYLMSKGRQPVNFDAFRSLPSSKATGAQQLPAKEIGR